MEPAAGFIGVIVKFPACMQRRKYQSLRADPLFMHSHRNPPAIVGYRSGTVGVQDYGNPAAIPCQMFVYRVIYNFINQMVQTLCGYTADIHSGPHPHCFQPFQYGNAGGIIGFILCHATTSFFQIYLLQYIPNAKVSSNPAFRTCRSYDKWLLYLYVP